MFSQMKLFNAPSLLLLLIGVVIHYFFPGRALLGDALLFIAVIVHASKLWGVRPTAIYVIIAMVIGYVAELIGIHTGWIFGAYHYNAAENRGLMGGVPLSIPIMYAILLYAGNFICIALSKKFLAKKNLWVLSLMTGFILMLKDVVTDPLQSTVYRVWIWDNGGDYFSVPIHNFIGWFAVFAVMTFAAVSLTWHKNRLSETIRLDKKVFYFPLFLFFVIVLFGLTSALSVPEAFRNVGNVSAFISVFVLAPYLLLAWFGSFKKE